MAISPFRFLALLALTSATANAAELQGAEAILKQLAEKTASGEKPVTPATLLIKRIDDFKVDAETMPPEKAAATWLALLDSYFAVPPESRYEQLPDGSRFSLNLIIAALPPVSAWDAIIAKIEKDAAGKKTLATGSMLLLAEILKKDPSNRTKAINDFIEAAQTDPSMQDPTGQARYAIRNFENLAKQLGGNETGSIESFIRTVKKSEPNEYNEITVPALVGAIDPQEAKDLLLTLLKGRQYISYNDPATRDLAAKIALENVSELPRPVWSLVETTADLPLYEALIKQFPRLSGDESLDARRAAETIYTLGLISSGKTDKAYEIISAPERQGRRHFDLPYVTESEPVELQEKVYLFLLQSLQKNPNLHYWPNLASLSKQLNKSDDILGILNDALNNPQLNRFEIKTTIEDLYLNKLFEASKTDEALESLAKFINQTRSLHAEEAKLSEDGDIKTIARSEDPFLVGASDAHSSSEEHPTPRLMDLLLKSIRIGQLLDRQDQVKTGLNELSQIVSGNPNHGSYDISSQTQQFIELLVKNDRLQDAEKVAASDFLAASISQNRSRQYYAPSSLSLVAWVYDQAGRHEDVIRLLDEAPSWAATDVIKVDRGRSGKQSLSFMAARALAATGRQEEAEKVLHRIIEQSPGEDAYYELLLQLKNPDTSGFLDRVFSANRFQERPLIWKAKLQLDQGLLAEAETTVRQAIAIDPSDGEEGKGDRMRAYLVLGEILKKQGDAEQAKLMENIITAIRISEDADDWWYAGLNSKAIELYEQALQSFADAYCIQSRLALRYAEQGNMEKAAEYYQRAFELMPDSFGRIESHCFGCEGAFRGEVAQKIADQVFTKLAEKPPVKPQVYYLLGYLRSEQSRGEDAVGYFRKAVELDPDYLNAWNKLKDSKSLSPAEKDDVAFAIHRLSPDNSRFSGVQDLRRLWTILLEQEKAKPVTEKEPVYLLKASAEKLKAQTDQERSYDYSRKPRPRATFAEHDLVRSIFSLVEATRSSN